MKPWRFAVRVRSSAMCIGEHFLGASNETVEVGSDGVMHGRTAPGSDLRHLESVGVSSDGEML